MKRFALPAIILIVGAGIFGIWWFSPTQVLKRQTQSLLGTLSFGAGTGKAGRQIGAYKLHGLLAAEVELETPTIEEANGTFERSELESAFSWLCTQARQSRFKLGKFHGVSIAGEKARVDLTLDSLVELPGLSLADGTYDTTLNWQKEKDGWRLTRAVWKKLP